MKMTSRTGVKNRESTTMAKDIWRNAIATQLLGATIAGIAWVVLVLNVEEVLRDIVVWAAFAVVYGLGIYAVFWELIRRDHIPGNREGLLTLVMCYVHVICLAILVFRTGGTGGFQGMSIFTPLFVIVLPISAAFLRHTQFSRLHVFVLGLFMLTGYVINFYGAPPIDILAASRVAYDIVILVVLAGSIGLSTWVGSTIRSP